MAASGRPVFTVLSAQIGPPAMPPRGYRRRSLVTEGHLATLYHDGRDDEAEVLRGAPTAIVCAGATNVAISAGNSVRDGRRGWWQGWAEAVRLIVKRSLSWDGQMRETRGVPKRADSIEHYLKVVYEEDGLPDLRQASSAGCYPAPTTIRSRGGAGLAALSHRVSDL